MIRAHHLSGLALAGLLAACSTAPETTTTYYERSAAPVGVAGSTATYSAGTGTVAGGVNTFSSTDRVIVGEPASKTVTSGTTANQTSTDVNSKSTMTQGAASTQSSTSGTTTTASNDPEKRDTSSPSR